MTKITTDQALERWDILPMTLREALYSEPNSDFLWKICEEEHIPDKQIYAVARMSGYVLMGFLHPEDVAEELHEAIGVDLKTASSIENELNKRIFAPLQTDIATVYKPLSRFEVAPKIMQEIKPPVVPTIAKPPTPVAPAPKIISETFTATPRIAPPPQAPVTQPVKPPTLSDQGWSKRSPQEPVVKLGQINPSTPAPAKPVVLSAPTTPAIAKPAAPRVGNTMSEFDRIDLMKKAPAPPASAPSMPAATAVATPTMLAPTKPPEPAPVMLHEISGTTTISQSPNLGMAAGTKNQIGANLPPPAAPNKPAVLEFATKTPTTSSAPAQKVVHYSEYKTPVPPPIPASNTPRQVTQIVAPTPITSPAQPSTPKTVTTPPPMPPKPQAAQPAKGKVIVKDFLS